MRPASEEHTSCSRDHSGDSTVDGLRVRGARRRICSCRSQPSGGVCLRLSLVSISLNIPIRVAV